MKKTFFCLLVLLGALAPGARAFDSGESCSGVSCYSRVDRVIIDASGIYIKPTVTLLAGKPNCKPESGVYFRLAKDHPNYDSVFQGVLFARQSGSPITVRINEGSNPCTISYIGLGSPF